MSMFFKRVSPSPALDDFVECFWIAERDHTPPTLEKIIPDGFTEIIFHYGDPYRINLHGHWEIQGKQLFCGQITTHFFLENTGTSGMFGIKFRPTALAKMFPIAMHSFTDKVTDLKNVVGNSLSPLRGTIDSNTDHTVMIKAAENCLHEIVSRSNVIPSPADSAVSMILEQHGMLSVADICNQLSISERNLERAFRQYVGLSPKFYARLIRFARIFQLIQEHQQEGAPWSDLVHRLGYYDQPHFIRNFRAFTGEEPSGYFFDHPTMANFFLVK